MLLGLSACAGSPPTKQPLTRQLPPAPAFAKRVKVKPPQAGEDAEVVAARERAGRAKANDIIDCVVQWHELVVRLYGVPPEAEGASQIRLACEQKIEGKRS